MKVGRFFIGGVLIILLVKLAVPSFVVVHFYWNRGLLTELYCENKANISMHCDGKCYLAKRLAKVESDQILLDVQYKRTISFLKLVRDVWEFQPPYKMMLSVRLDEASAAFGNSPVSRCHRGFVSSNFRPPCWA